MRYWPWMAALVVCACAASARAWLRMPYEDVDVVRRSDLIVVGAIKPGSVEYVPHPPNGDGGGHSWEHHVVLHVREVVKGTCAASDIAVTLEYGIDPFTGRPADHGPTTQPVTSAGPMPIYDSGNSARSLEPMVADALSDNVWLLRAGHDGRYHITDPQDLQPSSRREFLASYLTADPEAAVRRQIQRQPEIARDATRYLAHLEVQRLLKEPDLALRAERLLPYFESRHEWAGQFEGREALATCGAAGGPYLMAVYVSTKDADLRVDIINLWRRSKYAGAMDLLIRALDDGDRFWANQKLKAKWWNDDSNPGLWQARRESYCSVEAALGALGAIGDAKARPSIERTRRRWSAIAFDNSQMVQACDAALAALGPTAVGPPSPPLAPTTRTRAD